MITKLGLLLPSLSLALLTGCGGSFEGGGDDDGGSAGQAGSAGGGGQPSGGRTGSGGTPSAGTGSGGGSSAGCEWDGQLYKPGDDFPAGDGCNTCTCGSDGSVGCTLVFCDQCLDIQSSYAEALDHAKTCDPAQPDPCSEPVNVGLECGCTSFLNPEYADAIELLHMASQAYSELSCGNDVLCGECLPPTSAYCSAEGRCVDVFDMPGGGAACKVGGIVYESGSTGIQDPFSCNTCDCFDGQLGCTEIGCSTACPPNAVPATQCAQCGPTDGCEIVEHACLPVCTEICENGGACIDGVCRMVCG